MERVQNTGGTETERGGKRGSDHRRGRGQEEGRSEREGEVEGRGAPGREKGSSVGGRRGLKPAQAGRIGDPFPMTDWDVEGCFRRCVWMSSSPKVRAAISLKEILAVGDWGLCGLRGENWDGWMEGMKRGGVSPRFLSPWQFGLCRDGLTRELPYPEHLQGDVGPPEGCSRCSDDRLRRMRL